MIGSSQMIGASPAGADPGPMVVSSDFTADARREATRAKAREEVARAVAVMFRPGDVVEVRVPKAGRQRTISGYFNDPPRSWRPSVRWMAKDQAFTSR